MWLDKIAPDRDPCTMSHWPLHPQDITRPAYRSLAQSIAAAIDAGRLRQGDQLPPHRELAWRLKLSVQTVSRAYEELSRAGVIAGEIGRGSFVKSGPAERMAVPWYRAGAAQDPIDLSMITPVTGPLIAQAWQRTLSELAPSLSEADMFSFRPRRFLDRYSAMAAAWVARCGLVVPAGRVLLTNGATPALTVALSSCLVAGDELATEDLTHHLIGQTTRMLGVRIRSIPTDDQGMCPTALGEALRQGRIRALYLLTGGMGPKAQIMPAQRRKELVHIAQSHDLAIIESDPSGPIAPRRPAPLVADLPEKGFYLTSMAKCLSPGLRLGCLVVPEKAIETALAHHLAMEWMAVPVVAAIADRWINDGTADDLLRFQRAEFAARNKMALRLLPLPSLGHTHGLHRWLPLPQGVNDQDVVDQALARGVAISRAARFSPNGTAKAPAMRICLGGASRKQLEAALRILGDILSDMT